MLDDLLDLVIAAGLADEGEVHARKRPDPEPGRPVRALTVRYYGSEPPEETFSRTLLEWPRVQFEFREAPDRFPALERWARAALAWCAGFPGGTTAGGVEYTAVEPVTGIVDIGDDDAGNPLVAFSARVGRVSAVDGAAV